MNPCLLLDLGLTYLFISHDISVVKFISSRMIVMYLGKVMETGPSRDFFFNPRHPYSEALFTSVPSTGEDIRRERIILGGEVPSPIDPPSGCPFHPRCRKSEDICTREMPELEEIEKGHKVACYFPG